LDGEKKKSCQDRGPTKITCTPEGDTAEPLIATLVADRAAHVAELERLKATLLELPEATLDQGDPSIYERQKTLVLIQQIENHIAEIDHALHATRQGVYGICERCGQPIGRERLEILPETRLCVKCKSQTEKSKHPQG
jgi:RNA polymerase-binding transcription factor DksA